VCVGSAKDDGNIRDLIYVKTASEGKNIRVSFDASLYIFVSTFSVRDSV